MYMSVCINTPPYFLSRSHSKNSTHDKSPYLPNYITQPSRGQISLLKLMKIAKMEAPIISCKPQKHAIVLRTRAWEVFIWHVFTFVPLPRGGA